MILTKQQRRVAEHLAAHVRAALDYSASAEACLSALPDWIYDELIMSKLIEPDARNLSYRRLMLILDSLISAKLLESSPEERKRLLEEEERYEKDNRSSYCD